MREKFLKPNVLCILIGQACDQALSEKKRPMASTIAFMMGMKLPLLSVRA